MATATSKLQVIIDILGGDKAQSAITQIGIALAAAAGAAYTAKKAWDFAKEGAALELTATQFRNVAENAGYVADTLLGKMKQATGGLVTDAELMASGLQIIELGLADSEQGVVDLATVVSTLGLDMQQVIMTFANNSEMRLDALGLSVEGVKNRAAELKAEGFVGDAFDQAVLEGLTERMETLGDVTETTAGQMQRLETEWENLTNAGKVLAAQGIGGAVAASNDILDLMPLLNQAYQDGSINLIEYASLLAVANQGTEEAAAVTEILTVQTREAADADRLLGNYKRELNTETEKQVRGLTDSAGAVDFYAQRAQEASQASMWLGTQLRRTNEAASSEENIRAIQAAYQEVGSSAASATPSVESLMDQMNRNVDSQVENYIADLKWFIATGGDFEKAFSDIQNLDVDAATKLDLANKLLDPLEQAKDAIASGDSESLTGALAELDTVEFEIESIQESIDKADELQQMLNTMSSTTYSIDVSFNATPYPLAPGAPPPTGPAPAPTGPGPDVGVKSGFGTGGASTYVLIDTVYVQGDGQFLEIMSAQAQAGRRNSDSAAAGAGTVGI